MVSHTRRTLIIGAEVGAVSTHIVKATSLLDVPGGLRQAQRWAVEEFCEWPGCRLVFADGSSYKWMSYAQLCRWRNTPEQTFAVALETCVTDAEGRRAINTIPVDGVGLTRIRDAKYAAKQASEISSWRGWTPSVNF